jgi:hypothetical protein
MDGYYTHGKDNRLSRFWIAQEGEATDFVVSSSQEGACFLSFFTLLGASANGQAVADIYYTLVFWIFQDGSRLGWVGSDHKRFYGTRDSFSGYALVNIIG